MSPSSLICRKIKYEWHLVTSALYEGEVAIIDWRKIMPTGGTVGQQEALLRSLKELLEALIEYPVTKGRSSLDHSTVLRWCNQLRHLVGWMASQEIWRFSELGTQHLVAFLKTRRERHGPGHAAAATVRAFALLYRRMWELRAKYSAPLNVNPGLIEADVQLLRNRDSRPFKAIPEEVALPLLNDAIDWVSRIGPFMTRVATKLWQERIEIEALSKREKRARLRSLYEEISREPAHRELASALQMDKAGPYNVLCRAMTVTQGAAVIVVLFMVGMRVRELIRLDANCIQVEDNWAAAPVSYLNGIAAKAAGRQRRWVAGDPIPSVVEWVKATFEPARTVSNNTALFLARPNGALIPPPGVRARRMGSTTPTALMQAFADAPFRAGKPPASRLHPHAARKTFAKFVVKRDKRILEALSVHYGHAYREFTDGVYVGSDFQLSQLLEQEDRDDLSRTLTNLLQSPRMGGKAAQRIEDFRGQYQKDPAFAGKLGLETLVNSLIEKGVKIAPCDWGYCVYSESHSACRGDAAGPNEVLRAPDVCASCANFVVTTKHQVWWNERVSREEEFLGQRGLSDQARALVERRLTQSKALLTSIVARGVAKSSGRS